MADVVVYVSSVANPRKHTRKIACLEAFAEGARAQGASVAVEWENRYTPSHLAVILGWVGTTIRGPHIQLRQNVIDHQRRTGHHVMPIDASCFKFVDIDSYFLRYSLDGVFYNTNNYANANSNNSKWQQIQQRFNLSLSPWRTQGTHVLVCLQRDGGWSMKGIDMAAWTRQTVQRLRSITNRPIVIRPHPKHKINLSELTSLPGVSESVNGSTLQQDLANAWAAVFCNSSSSVAAVLAGIPVFADDDDCVAWAVANEDLAQIESPAMPDRTQWLNDLSSAHWTDEESRSGVIYQRFVEYL